MSGGAFNYACYAERPTKDDLILLAETIETIRPGSRAAQLTRKLAEDDVSQTLRTVWHDVEWWKSGDLGQEHAEAAADEFEQAEPSIAFRVEPGEEHTSITVFAGPHEKTRAHCGVLTMRPEEASAFLARFDGEWKR